MPRPDRYRMRIYALFDAMNESELGVIDRAIMKAMDWCHADEGEATHAFAYWVLYRYKRKVEEAKPKPKPEPEQETYGFKGWAPEGWMTCPECKGFGVLGDRNDFNTWKPCPTCKGKELVKKEGGGDRSEEPEREIRETASQLADE